MRQCGRQVWLEKPSPPSRPQVYPWVSAAQTAITATARHSLVLTSRARHATAGTAGTGTAQWSALASDLRVWGLIVSAAPSRRVRVLRRRRFVPRGQRDWSLLPADVASVAPTHLQRLERWIRSECARLESQGTLLLLITLSRRPARCVHGLG